MGKFKNTPHFPLAYHKSLTTKTISMGTEIFREGTKTTVNLNLRSQGLEKSTIAGTEMMGFAVPPNDLDTAWHNSEEAAIQYATQKGYSGAIIQLMTRRYSHIICAYTKMLLDIAKEHGVDYKPAPEGFKGEGPDAPHVINRYDGLEFYHFLIQFYL